MPVIRPVAAWIWFAVSRSAVTAAWSGFADDDVPSW
jgi:hypothetical protein